MATMEFAYSRAKHNDLRLDVEVFPEGTMEILSQLEVNRIKDTGAAGLHRLFRQCALAVLQSGAHLDDTKSLLEAYKDFHIELAQQDRGIKLRLHNAPAAAFVDGQMIRGIREHLFAVLRDIVFVANEIENNYKYDLDTSTGISNAVFHILRNARIFDLKQARDLVVCWGGHAVSREEYDYSKQVGYELGLRGFDICTGCGVGAMKGPMKGATIAHAKQRIRSGRYIGLTEPGIIAAETPNALVNALVIMPDIEKRLEAFVRAGHAVVVFPGGAGTAEELLYLLGILLHQRNRRLPFPLVLTGPSSAAGYFESIDRFVATTLGDEARSRYVIMLDDPSSVARAIARGLKDVRAYRDANDDAHYFNWSLHIEGSFQVPFDPTHENMEALPIHRRLPAHELAANLRRAFSGVVAGNVKEAGIRRIERNGPYRMRGEPEIMQALDALLSEFIEQRRMRINEADYRPCFQIVH